MRNLKRALSLTLASVMLLGMMVVGSSAAAGYDDVAETDNVEAIEVLQAIEVMVGDERGFGPERTVNRAEMAVVMGKLLSLDYNYYEATCPFNDVYDWAQGWVGACYANGIVSGRGEGVYDPGTTVTAVEAASMLMRALGYFKYQSDYADGFEVATVRQANLIGLFNGVNSKTNEPLTRNQVAQMALNALKSGVVTPDGNTTNFVDANGNLIGTVGRVNYVYTTSNKSYATAISDVRASSMGSANDAPIVELGEQLYDGKLKLRSEIDAFGRPSRHWEFDAKEIGTYVKEELIRQEYTNKVTGRDLYDRLGGSTIKEYDLDVYIDGVDDPAKNANVFGKGDMVRTNDVGVGATGKGVLTQVFVDPDEGSNGLVTIAVINTYLAIADEDFDDRTDDLDITVYGIDPIPNYPKEYYKTANAVTDDGKHAPTNESSAFKLETEDFPKIVDAKDGDAFLVTVAQGEVQTIAAPEILEGSTITTFKQGSYVVTGGTQYDFANATEYHFETLYDYTTAGNSLANLKDITYNIYLDKYGYAIGVKEVDRVDNYLFITGVDTNTNNRYAVQADGSAIFLDGTMEAIKIDLKAARDLHDNNATYNALTGVYSDGEKGGSLVNSWFTYTVDSNGVYEVVLVGGHTAIDNNNARAAQWVTEAKTDNDPDGVKEIGPKSIALRGTDKASSPWYSVYGDDKSVYITAELSTIQDAHNTKQMVNVISGVDNVVVGVDDASIEIWSKAAAASQDDGAKVGIEYPWTAYGAYTLFDKDGDVIAAVVVGEDSGSVTNLVYTHEGRIESETDNNAGSSRASSKGDYTWTRKVISGSTGEEILLTEIGSGLSELKSMLPNTWYVVKYNAKGEVKNVYEAWSLNGKGLIDANALNEENDVKRLEDRYVNDIEELNQATNENGTVLYEVGQYNNKTDLRIGSINVLTQKPSVDNHTFYVKTATSTSVHQGFRVADDVKTVFIQTNNNNTTTTYESGYSRLEKVVSRLHDSDKDGRVGYNYEVSAVMQNSKAIVVVIRDLNKAGASNVQANRELRLYGNLFTALNGTVTGASNAVVVANGEEVKPTGVNSDEWGNYTIYSIPVGATVGITDYDIDNVNTVGGFTYMTNMVYSDLRVRELNRSISFTMPGYNAWINGGKTAFTDSIRGLVGASVAGVDVEFNGNQPGQWFAASYNSTISTTFTNKAGSDFLKDGVKYTVTMGATPYKAEWTGECVDGVLSIPYVLNGQDLYNGYVQVYKIVNADGSTPVDPKPPVPGKTFTASMAADDEDFKEGAKFNVLDAETKEPLDVDKIADGAKVILDPAEALTAEGGVVNNGDGTWKVTGDFTVKSNGTYVWSNGFFGQPAGWMTINAEGKPVTATPVVPLSTAAAALKRFSTARAVGDSLNAAGCLEVIARDGAFKAEVTVDGTTTTWVGTAQEGSTLPDLTVNPVPTTAAGIRAAIKSLRYVGSDNEYVVYTEIEKPDTEDPNPPITGSRTLTLKGTILAANSTSTTTNTVAKVYAGPAGSKPLPEVAPVAVSTNEGLSFTYSIPAGYDVEVQPSSTDVINTNLAKTFRVDGVVVKGTNGTPDKLNFTMDKDLELKLGTNDTAPSSWVEIVTVTVNDGITGTWTSSTDKVTSAAPGTLASGKQYLPADAVIAFTNNGNGSVILKDSFYETGTGNDTVSGTLYGKDNTATLNMASGTDVVLRSAVKVFLMSNNMKASVGANAAIADTGSDKIAANKNWAYVALGQTLILENGDSGDYTGFLAGAETGAKLGNNRWTVSASTETDKSTKIYGAYQVNLGTGVTAVYDDTSTKSAAAKAVKSGDYLAGGKYVFPETSVGTDVVAFPSGRNTSSAAYDPTVAAIGADMTLDAATKVTFVVGEAMAWGKTEDCTEIDFYDASGALEDYGVQNSAETLYVKTADKIYLKVSDKEDAPAAGSGGTEKNLAVYVGGVKDETVKSVGMTIVFQVGGKAITVREDMTPGDIEEAKKNMVDDARAATVGGGTVVSAEKGRITTADGTVLVATGCLEYVGARVPAGADKVNIANTVAGDLGRFLQGLYALNDASGTSGADYGDTTLIYYGGKTYKWNDDSALNGCKYENADGDSLISVIVADTKDKLTKDGDTLDIKLTCDDVEITFRVIIDETYTTDASGKQVPKT